MTIYIGADHRGFELKNKLIEWLKDQGHEVEDCGNSIYDPQDDYPDFAHKVAKNIVKDNSIMKSENARFNATWEVRTPPQAGEHAHGAGKRGIELSLGIVICGSGVGVSVAAHRHRGIISA